VRQTRREDAGRKLADTVRQYMRDLGVDDGIRAVGYSRDDIPALVKATLPQVGWMYAYGGFIVRLRAVMCNVLVNCGNCKKGTLYCMALRYVALSKVTRWQSQRRYKALLDY
jgi:hypothetical protein